MNIARRSRAFTLLELLAAAALTAVLVLALSSALAIAWRARGSAQAQISSTGEAALVLELMRQDLQSIPPATGVMAGAFTGTQEGEEGRETDTLTFYTFGRDPDGNEIESPDPLVEGLRRVEYALASGSDGGVLTRRVQRNLLAVSEPSAEEEALSRRVRALAIRYFDGQEWVRSWDSAASDNRLPLAIAIDITCAAVRPDASDHRVSAIVPLACGEAAESTGPGVVRD